MPSVFGAVEGVIASAREHAWQASEASDMSLRVLLSKKVKRGFKRCVSG